jgi:hypothetical protein
MTARDKVCDHIVMLNIHCPNTPTRAPRLVVASKTPLRPDHKPLKMFTTLHYCEWHTGHIQPWDLLQPQIIRDFELAAKLKRPIDFVPDFDIYDPSTGKGGCFIEYVLVTTPEYRRFERALGIGGKMRAALGVTRLAG